MEKKEEQNQLEDLEKLTIEEMKEMIQSLSKDEIFRLLKMVMESGEVHD